MASSSTSSTSKLPYQHTVDGEDPGGARGDTGSENIVSKEDLKAYLQEQLDNRQLSIHDQAIFTCDLFFSVPEPDDPISRSILDFRDNARRAISTGLAVESVLDACKPDFTLMFRDRKQSDPHTAWSWACDYGKAFDHFSFSLRLAHVYMAGIQMRVRNVFITIVLTICNKLTVLHSSLCRNLQRFARNAATSAETIQACSPGWRRYLPHVSCILIFHPSVFVTASSRDPLVVPSCLR
jgi:hypothetical protein